MDQFMNKDVICQMFWRKCRNCMVTFSRSPFAQSQILNTDKSVKKTAQNFQILSMKLTTYFAKLMISYIEKSYVGESKSKN